MSDDDQSPQPTADDASSEARNERAKYLGIGIGLLIAGSGMLARFAGWTESDTDFLLPAIFIGLAVNYLYRAIAR